ncbi:hypothetical protein [Sporomusa sp.]|uniref:hypothetical protein n=1 Tax=Sporomusa sp. TaxID=2078658 RepID=UPI002D014478|nr:hypothetical protein [Sporomusa sp.]HWR42356.1 hypothetical protein [Sporomusa sp.]
MVVIKLRNSVHQTLPDKYKTLEDFYEDINTYEEIIFEYNEQKYVVTYYDNKLSVIEYNAADTEQQYTSPQDFAENFSISGNRFKDIITKISVLVR